MAQLNFNATQVAPNAGFEPIPTGNYICVIEESEMKPTKNNDGAYLQLKMKVIDGQYAGKVIFDRLNIQNQNKTAVEIAYGTLSAICHATGVMQVQDSQQLHGIPMDVRVVYKEPANGYDASNDVKGYKPAPKGAGQQPQQQQPDQQPGQQQQWQQPEQQPNQQQQWQQPNQTQQPAQGGGAGGNDVPPWMQNGQ